MAPFPRRVLAYNAAVMVTAVSKTRPRLRGCLLNLTLAVVSLVLSCGAGELIVRLYKPQPLEAAYVWPDGTLRHLPSFSYRYTRRGFSNIVSYNALGLRGPEVAVSKTPGVPRVMLLGDSFVEGKQVADDEVLTTVMQRLAAAGGRPIEVLNAGVSGYGTAEELILWEKLGRALVPDLVLVGFYPNDVRNNEDRGFFDVRDGRVVAVKAPPLPNVRLIYDVRKWFASRSHVYMLFKQGIDALTHEASDDTPARGAPLEAEEVFARAPSKRVAHGWELTLALLGELRARVEARGARFAVVLLPTRFQVDDALWASQTRRAGFDPAGFDLRLPQQAFSAWSERTGTPVIDLLDQFRARNRANSFYHEVDAHWNRAGHALAAELTIAGLEARGLPFP